MIRLDYSPSGDDRTGRPVGYVVARCECGYWSAMTGTLPRLEAEREALERAAIHERLSHPGRDDAARRLRRRLAQR